MSDQLVPHVKSFWMGTLAHLILVPSWLASPFILLGSVVLAGAPHGWKGVLGSLGLGACLSASQDMVQRVPLCLSLLSLASSSPPDRGRLRATLAACLASFLTWLCKGGKGDWARRPGLLRFLRTWRADYYEQAELRGCLDTIQPRKTCLAFHPHGCLSAGFNINGVFNSDIYRVAGKLNWLIDWNLRFKNPMFRWLCDSIETDQCCIQAVDRTTILRLMQRSENIAIIPGGFQDAVAYSYGKDVTVVKKRKGLIKYCLQFGYRMHPVYTFGEHETYHAFTGLRKLRMKIAEQNIPMVFPFGATLMPFLPTYH
eukprot:TRINITY_DN25774_c0_g1_i2.p1 TRINITY_DN25774_c0_g1~~TRINITY_DN25774_c0_g1_i2.p1  ORF type:complete len:313 (+),score=33.09 TRINITY_DN25774_c0_g1_i2:69-1007(+)